MNTAMTESGEHLPLGRVLRLREVCHVTGLGRSIIYRMQQTKRFPQSVKITDYAVGWIEAEVRGWLAQRAATRSVPQAQKPDHLR